MKKNAFVFAAFAAMACGAQADSKSNLSAEYQDCASHVNLGVSMSTQWAVCDEAELPRLDKKLNQIYDKVGSSLDTYQKAEMLKGQKAWLEYRESWCRFREQAQLASLSGYVAFTSCMVEMADQKISELSDMAKAAQLK